MDVNNQKLRDGIIAKLKQYDAYIDNELPDYIIVMLANKKSMLQVKNDLQLFLGSNTDAFTDWLQKAMIVPNFLEESMKTPDTKRTQPASDDENDATPKVITLPGVREKKTGSEFIELHVQESQADSLMVAQDTTEESRQTSREHERQKNRGKSYNVRPDSTRGQDLRTFIAQRREEKNRGGLGGRHSRYDNESESSDEEKEAVSTSLSSVVKIMKRERPQLNEKGGGRLLQKALLGLGRKRSSRGGDDDVDDMPPTKLKARRKEGGSVKKVLRVKKEDLSRILSSQTSPKNRKSPKKTTVSQVSSTKSQERGHTERSEYGEMSEGSEAGDQVVIELERDDSDIQDQIIEKATIAAVRSVLPMAARLGRKRKSSEPTDLRDIITRKSEESDSSTTRFVVTLDGTEDSYQSNSTVEGTQEQQEVHSNATAERCRFWPNCRNGDNCSYIHPTVPCKLFPNCKYGNRCLYVHPQCKFDSKCTRPGCPYLHTAPRHLTNTPAIVPMPSPVPMFKPKPFSFSPSSGASPRFPDKSALTWKPSKHISERKFAVPEDQATALT